MILANPSKHLAMTAPVLWRGAFWTFPALALFLFIALALRRADLVGFALPAVGLILFHALTTHSNPRHNICTEPVVIIGLVFLAHWLVRRLGERAGTAYARHRFSRVALS
jgi:hypothetical protein